VISIQGPNSNLNDCVHNVGFEDNTIASFNTTFRFTLTDRMEYSARSAGILEKKMGIDDSTYNGSVDININLKITVASGWGLAGVKDYKASNTLLDDAWNILLRMLEPLIEPLREIMSMIMDALSVLSSAIIEVAKYVAEVVERLYSALMEPLERLKRLIEEKITEILNPILESVVEKVEWIVGADLNKQTVGFTLGGFTLTFTTKMSSWVDNTKTLVIAKLSGTINDMDISVTATIKLRGSGANKEYLVTGGAEIKAEGWNIVATIDPLMKSSKYMIAMNGSYKGTVFDILMPDLVQYKHIDFTLSDIPAIGLMLSNIPLPFPGLKASIDAGIDLKYNIPFETGILINEFELNPPGDDKGAEWVEILNATYSTVDIDGYTLHAGSNPIGKTYTISGVSLSPGQREVITLPGSFLNNSVTGGEYIILRSPQGNEVDKTPGKRDSSNDSRTWQRVADGAVDWTFAEGTPGGGNCGGLVTGEMIKIQILKVLTESAVGTMNKMKNITSVEELSEFFKIAIQDAITKGIEMIAGCLVEAAIFISIEITDATSSAYGGFRIALFIDSGFVEDGLKYLVGEIESILFNIKNPYGLNPKDVFTDNLYLGITVYAGISAPMFLKEIEELPQVRLGVQINSNISALITLIGESTGTWKVTAGVVIIDCPTILLPSMIKHDKTLDSDLWLIRATFVPK